MDERPVPASDAVRQRMQSQRTRDTEPELALRRELFRRGLRYRLQRRPLIGLRRQADLVFPGPRVAVFVHGCFWHGCPEHATSPKANAEFWRAKLDRNRERDAETLHLLEGAGWATVVVWEHEDPVEAADRVAAIVEARRSRSQVDG